VLCRVMCVMLFVAWTAEWPVQAGTGLYCELWRSSLQALGPLFVSVPGISLMPWQILLMVLAPVCILWPGAFRGRALAMDWAILTSFGSVALTFFWGLARGGSAYNAHYQLWRFLAALLVGVLLLSVVRSSRHLRALGLTVLLAALVRGTLAIYFYWTQVRDKIVPPPPHMTTHDDSLLFVAGLLVVLSWALARGGRGAWFATVVVFAHLSYAIVLNNRRLAWIELLFGLVIIYLILPRGRQRRRVNRRLLFAAPVVLVYVVAGWNSAAPAFAPVRAFATAGSNADASSLARQEEIRNLLYTLSRNGNPLLGTGWGRPYEKVTSVYANFGEEWWQYGYLPHNSLLGVAAFGGLVGVFGIWLVVPVAAFLATRGYREATRHVDRAAAMAAVSILPAYSAQCFGDVGFQSLTGNLILAVAIGVAGKVAAWGALATSQEASAASEHTAASVI
jgi:hypothetical protein